ncbi:MAG: hypothetical protein HXY34_06625 [Candidatus Thorarchaeota archaeon]|nr:hypothetical protein [Candidatus Thorarchaeota archaeon]
MLSLLGMLSYGPETGIQVSIMVVILLLLIVSIYLMEETLVDGHRKAKNGGNRHPTNRFYMMYTEHPLIVDCVHIVTILGLVAVPFVAWAVVGLWGLILVLGVLVVSFRGSFHHIDTLINARYRQRLEGEKFMVREYMRLTMLSGAGAEDIDGLLKRRVDFLVSGHSNSPRLTQAEVDEILSLLATDSDAVGLAARRLLGSQDQGRPPLG